MLFRNGQINLQDGVPSVLNWSRFPREYYCHGCQTVFLSAILLIIFRSQWSFHVFDILHVAWGRLNYFPISWLEWIVGLVRQSMSDSTSGFPPLLFASSVVILRSWLTYFLMFFFCLFFFFFLLFICFLHIKDIRCRFSLS